MYIEEITLSKKFSHDNIKFLEKQPAQACLVEIQVDKFKFKSSLFKNLAKKRDWPAGSES